MSHTRYISWLTTSWGRSFNGWQIDCSCCLDLTFEEGWKRTKAALWRLYLPGVPEIFCPSLSVVLHLPCLHPRLACWQLDGSFRLEHLTLLNFGV